MSAHGEYTRLIFRMVDGARVDSRYGPTVEVLNLRSVWEPDSYPRRRGMAERLGWMEALQVVAGVFFPEALKQVAPRANHGLFTQDMAYGPRLGEQVDFLIKYLLDNPLGRQGTIWIARPEDGCTSRQTCTTSLHLLLRGKLLHMTVNMRSWDLVKGAPYDVLCFQLLNSLIARCLMVGPGPLVVNAVSAHTYVADAALAVSVGTASFRLDDAVPYDWRHIQAWARGQVATYSSDCDWPEGIVRSHSKDNQ